MGLVNFVRSLGMAMKTGLSLMAALVLGLAACPAAVSTNTFDVRGFGAKGDGATLDTQAIQSALDACGNAGGGTVLFPKGTYLSQPIQLRTQTTVLLEAGATLLASPAHSHFLREGGDWLKARSSDFIPFVSGRDLTNIAITGQGTIDGNGAVWWEEAEKARRKVSGYTLPRPNLIALSRCENVRVAGIRIVNSPKFHLVPSDCEQVVIDGITILAPEGAANTDGIDPSNSRNVKITRCLIDCGDDNIAIKSGRKVEGREFGCENIEVTDCVFKHGHGMSIGSEVVGGVRNVTVRNCTFQDTDNGLRIKSRRDRGGVVENVFYSNITMTNVFPAISIAATYQDSTRTEFNGQAPAQPFGPTTPVYRNLRFLNITSVSTNSAGLIAGLPESPVQNVSLENVRLQARTGLTIAHAKDIRLTNVLVTVTKGQPFILQEAQVEGLPQGK
jgi:polygalacturonase